jgi:4-hydroxybenzoate polyprenyltransferase
MRSFRLGSLFNNSNLNFHAHSKLNAYLRLIRFDRPVGTILVLMPTLWSLWIAGEGKPSWRHVVVFTLGSFLMRSAGCVINDIADRKIDPEVKRTQSRPIASGEVGVKEGVVLFTLLVILSFLLVLMLNRLTLLLSVFGLCLAIIYPFTKRFFSAPQFVLGISFGWGVILAWAAVRNRIELPALLLFIANIFWSLAYDTIYALMDREDDLKIGVKSTAILFGKFVWLAVGMFLISVLLFLGWAGFLVQLGSVFFIALFLTGLLFALQVYQLKKGPSSEIALRLFKSHGPLGTLIFIGIVLDYYLK